LAGSEVKEMFSKNDLKILFEDNHLFVCFKPAGVLSQADGKALPDMLTVIKDYLKDKYQKPGNVYLGLVHRLDLNVGGVMVFAKTSKAAARLSESIREHEFSKRYYAIINGRLPVGETKTLTDYLAKDDESRTGFVVEEKTGKEAKLAYTVLETLEEGRLPLSLVKIELFSGRFHQIRVQMSHAGYPLFGDQKYGEKTAKDQDMLGLFAYELDFVHPITKDELRFSAVPETGIFAKFHYFAQ
jgi:23S rRNA pseudouridine1911/1915/1917 synthase